jgi:hypothetical protein
MGLFSKKKKTTTTPVYGAQIEGAANQVQNVFNAQQPGLNAITSQITGALPGLGARAFGEDETVTAAQGYARDAIGGKYLDSNPYIDEMAGIAARDAGDEVNSYFGKIGRVGGGAHQESLGRGISEAILGVRNQNYNSERDRQAQAASLSPSLNAGQYAGIPAFLQTAEAGAELPYTGAKTLASTIAGLLGQYTTTKSKNSGGLGSVLAGALAGGFGG